MNIDGAAPLAASQAVTEAKPAEKADDKPKEETQAAAQDDAVKVEISAESQRALEASEKSEA